MAKNYPKKLSIGFLYDDTLDKTDGVAQYVKTLGAWLAERGHKVSYLVGQSKTKKHAGGAVYSLAKNIKVNFNANQMSIPLLANRGDIKELLNKNKFDVLHVQVPYSPLLAKRVINYADPTTAIVGTFHIYPSSKLTVLGSKALKIWLGKSLKRFDEIISVSPAAANFAQSAFGIKTKILPNMIDIRKMQTKAAIKPKHIVFLGRLVERKGIMQLLRAFKIIKKNYPKARLTIGGDGPLRTKIEDYVKRHKLSDSVKLVGFVPEEVKPNLLASADVACFPSLYGESFGIVLLEAMASGANVVLGGNNPGYASVLGEKKDLLVDPKDSKEFAARLQKFITDKALVAKLHIWQRKHIKKYDVAVVGPKIENIYFQAIANRTKSRHN